MKAILFALLVVLSARPVFSTTLGGLNENAFPEEFAHVTDLLEKGQYPEAEAAAKILIPKYSWGFEGPLPVERAAYAKSTFTEYLKIWQRACKNSGHPQEMERLYDICFEIGRANGQERTSEFENLCWLAAENSVELKHYARVANFCELALDSLSGTAAWKNDRAIRLANKMNFGESTKYAATVYHLLAHCPEYQSDLVQNHSALLRNLTASKIPAGADQVVVSGTEIIAQSIKDPRIKKFFNDFIRRRIGHRQYDPVAVVFSEWASRKNAEKLPLRPARPPRPAVKLEDALLASLIVQDGFGGYPQAAVPMCKLQIELAEKEHKSADEMVKIYSTYRCILQSCNLPKQEAAAAAQVSKYSARAAK